ncbi:unnamed protein product [Gordionus sp. m RMFG-2023]|uniref:L-aminoadipate-semialdehyde dehydrogenase-phosphopantetheinyl transferase-like n=1 Tax=Gordionus sp. m RMFG-2023 TaxID=3053472 RepID=UPI0030E2DDDB
MDSYRWAFNFKEWHLNPNDLCFASKCLSSEEKTRILKFQYIRDVKAALSGRLLLHLMLCRLKQFIKTKTDDINIEFTRSNHGKPILDIKLDKPGTGDINNLYMTALHNYSFNISHQGSYSVLASSPIYNVGIDIMSIDNFVVNDPLNEKKDNSNIVIKKDIKNFFNTMRNVFTDNEWKYIKSAAKDSTKIERFLCNWCLKESFVKAKGNGISSKLLRSIEFSNINYDLISGDNYLKSGPKLALNNVVDNDWRFQCQKLDLHIIAIAFSKHVDNDCKNDIFDLIEKEPMDFTYLTFEDIKQLTEQLIYNHDIDVNFADSIMQKL